MTALAPPLRGAPTRARTATRARGGTRVAPSATKREATTRKTTTRKTTTRVTRVATAPHAIGRLGTVLAVVTVLALIAAVVFHVILAQHQLELDHLGEVIAKEQRTYEQRRLTNSILASPQRVIQEAQRLGLVEPEHPAQYLDVPNAPMPEADDGSTADTLKEWSDTKSSLGTHEP